MRKSDFPFRSNCCSGLSEKKSISDERMEYGKNGMVNSGVSIVFRRKVLIIIQAMNGQANRIYTAAAARAWRRVISFRLSKRMQENKSRTGTV